MAALARTAAAPDFWPETELPIAGSAASASDSVPGSESRPIDSSRAV